MKWLNLLLLRLLRVKFAKPWANLCKSKVAVLGPLRLEVQCSAQPSITCAALHWLPLLPDKGVRP